MKDANKNTVEPFKVYIRIRPLLERELKQIASINQENANKQIDKSTLAVENNTVSLLLLSCFLIDLLKRPF